MRGRYRDVSPAARAAIMALAMLAGENSAFAGELIPAVASLQSHREAVVVDARPGAECLKATIPGALCLSLDNVLNANAFIESYFADSNAVNYQVGLSHDFLITLRSAAVSS